MEKWIYWYETRYYRRKHAYFQRKKQKEKNHKKMPSWMVKMYSELGDIQITNGTSIYLIS